MDYRHANVLVGSKSLAQTSFSVRSGYWLRGVGWQLGLAAGRLVRHRYIRQLQDWQARATQRRALAELSTAQLADVGLSRTDVLTETRLPFWRRTAGPTLSERFNRLAARRRLATAYRRNYSELQSLDDRMLSDVGVLNRSDLQSLARHAAIGDELRWRRSHRG